VIASIGRDSLLDTLDVISTWTVALKEVIVVFPENSLFNIAKEYSRLNIVILRMGIGQVAQRSFGFKFASGDVIVQSDDDIRVDANSIAELVSFVNQTGFSAGPVLYASPGGAPFFSLPRTTISKMKESVLAKLLGFPTSGEQMGRVSRAGVTSGVDPAWMEKSVIEVDWLPGGFAVHLRKNLTLENYFPFQGRACYEDLIHSLILRERGVKLVTLRSAKAELKIDIPRASLVSVLRELRILYYVVGRFRMSKPRFVIWFFYRTSVFIIKSLFFR
jgi:hypothetical protein